MTRLYKHLDIWKFLLIICVAVSGCSAPAKLVSMTPMNEPAPASQTVAPSVTMTPFKPIPPTNTLPPPPTMTPFPTWTRTPTLIPSPTPTATWIFNDAGKVTAPILLYHHVADTTPLSRYYVSPVNFQAQMQALKDLGYTTITPSYLRQVLVYGGDLPSRPVIITFDDGDIDVYQNALPVMRTFGFIGAFYVVSGNLGAEGYVGVDQLKEMIADGWEIGSHTINHFDLTANHDSLRNELLQSRLDIQTALSITVTSIAYPYGLVDAYVATKSQDYGYETGMGLGIFTEHTLGTIYYLNRREVHGDMDLSAFTGLLSWSGANLTPTPSPAAGISSTSEVLAVH
jgi:peptidoglycan/xylan/chitin deacetylase (PgdA/CDA1 family)